MDEGRAGAGTGTPVGTPTGVPNTSVRVQWAGGGRYDAGRPLGPTVRLDSTGATGPSPVDTLLAALGTCASIDVVDILAKRRTPVTSLSVDVVAERVQTVPRRVRHATLHFTIAGEGIDRVQTERAIELAVTKYCSVRDSLREDIAVEWTLTLGVSGASAQSTASSMGHSSA